MTAASWCRPARSTRWAPTSRPVSRSGWTGARSWWSEKSEPGCSVGGSNAECAPARSKGTTVLRIARAFDSLEGYPPFVHSCPLISSFTSSRVVFHTATGDVTAHYVTSVCSFGTVVRRDGAVVRPTLSGGARLVAALGPAH